MTAFAIILIIIAFLLLLLLIPVHFYIDYNGENVKLKIRYLFFKIQLYPKKKKKKEKKKKSKKRQPAQKPVSEKEKLKKESIISRLVKVHGVGGVKDILLEGIDILKEFLNMTTRHILIKKLNINIVTGGDDAAAAAMNFGYACDSIYPALGVLSGIVKLHCIPKIEISADFYSKKSSALLYADTAIRPLFVIAAVIIKGIKALKLYSKAVAPIDT